MCVCVSSVLRCSKRHLYKQSRHTHSQDTATHGHALQHATRHCNSMQHTLKHCNTLQITASHYDSRETHTATCTKLSQRPDDSCGGESELQRKRSSIYLNAYVIDDASKIIIKRHR